MIKRILTLFAIVALFGLFMVPSGCVKEDFDKVPPLEDTSAWVKTVSIAQVKALFESANNPARVAGLVKKLATNDFWNAIIAQGVTDSSIIFEGRIISCDSASNFYETITIVDETGGIDLKINASEVYLTYGFKTGKKVLVKINDLGLDNYHGSYQLGLATTDAGAVDITGIDPSKINSIIQKSGARINMVPDTLKINEITAANVQKLIQIDSVQFWNPAATYSIPGVNTNRVLIDKYGRQIILRTSGFAKFSSETVANGSGSIVGVLGVYDGTYQLYIRDLNDVKFTDPRFGASAPLPNMTIAELKALCTSNLVAISQDVVVDGVVCANDESGNLYKQLFIEDETGAIEFKVDMAGLYTDFPIGTKVVINCNGLYVGKYGGVVQLGGIYNSSIGRLSSSIFYNKVFIVQSGLTVTPVETTVSGLNDNLIGKVITISDIQFSDNDLGKTFAVGTTTTNRYIEDINGSAVIVRTSGYADFAGIEVPRNRGKITAVLSKYYNDYQLYIRSMADVRMVEPRIVKLVDQRFTSASLGVPISVDGWQTIAVAGTKRWMANSVSGNVCAEFNPYNATDASNVGWLISPSISISNGLEGYISFKTQYFRWAGSTLEVYISKNFDGVNPTTAQWDKIENAKIVVETDGENTWVSSGITSIGKITGNFHIGFKYTGSGLNGVHTAFRVDNVAVFTN